MKGNIMSYRYSQPDELDIAQQEMDEREIKTEGRVTDTKYLKETVQDCWHGGYVPPYRAAYFRAGN
jgi:hypothetical protein